MELMLIIAFALILVTAFMFAPLGLGGGVLYVPIFIYLLDWEIHLALVTSLLLVWMVSLGSRLAHQEGGYADEYCGKKGIATALPGTLAGTLLASVLIAAVGSIAIKAGAVAILIFVIQKNLLKLRGEMNGSGNDNEEAVLEGQVLRNYRMACFGAGASSGMLGIGGGALFVTTHRSLLNYNAHRAAGTSYIIESWMVPLGVIAHLIVDGTGPALLETGGMTMLIIIPIAVAVAAYVGARFAIKKLPMRILTMVFIVAVSASLARYLWDFGGLIL